MNEAIKKNLEAQMNMLREISYYSNNLGIFSGQERKFVEGAINSLRRTMKIVNSSLPDILDKIYELPNLPSRKNADEKVFEKVVVKKGNYNIEVVLNKKLKSQFLKELSINEDFVNKIRKGNIKKKIEKIEQFEAARGYLRLSNKIFLERAKKLVARGKFRELGSSIKRANIDVLFESYISMIFFTTLLAFVVSILVTIFLVFFSLSFSPPFFSLVVESFFTRIVKIFWIPIVLPAAAFLSTYFYPMSEKKSIGAKINQELPFAVIHMSAISGSGIAPSEIFKIIVFNREYKHLRKEVRKVLNQINLYGYDLVTALNNAAKIAPSDKLADLFSGLSSTITSGANLSTFFEKRSESLLLEYRVEREKYTKLIETFLDIYISVVIAAPMVFLLLLILMSVSGIQVGFTSLQLSIFAVMGIAILNIIFLAILQMKEPPY